MDDVVVAGALSRHPLAEEFAREVRRIHARYAHEVVAHYRLCPHIGDPDTAFGRFVVMLDRTADLESAAHQVRRGPVVRAELAHLIFPLVRDDSVGFERFASRLHVLVQQLALADGRDAPVHATFHPEMDGDETSAARLVGLTRRAPDPFVQFVPAGLQPGGTAYVDLAATDLLELANGKPPRSSTTFERLAPVLPELRASLRDIRRDRDESYARYLDALS